MKITSFLFAFLFTLSSIFAQELKIKYDIVMKSSDPEMQAQLQMTEGSSLTIYTKDDKSRVEMDMGGIMKTTTILDGAKNKGLKLMDGMFGKQAATFEGEDIEKLNEVESEYEIEYTNDTKEILGYKCKKAIVFIEEENVEMYFWYTEEIKTDKVYLGEYSKYGAPGVPLEYGVEQTNLTMKFVAMEIERKLMNSESLFSIKIPEGYAVKSYKEINNMSGQ